jgi:hypothetical protein
VNYRSHSQKANEHEVAGLLHWFDWNAKRRIHACADLTLKEEI